MALDSYIADMICSLGMLDPILGGETGSALPWRGVSDPNVRSTARCEGRAPGADPEQSPQLDELSCPPTSASDRDPDRPLNGPAASIPRSGRCRSPTAVRPRGDPPGRRRDRFTPAYLESVASFYDLLHTKPVGAHRIEVCTNVSCWPANQTYTSRPEPLGDSTP